MAFNQLFPTPTPLCTCMCETAGCSCTRSFKHTTTHTVGLVRIPLRQVSHKDVCLIIQKKILLVKIFIFFYLRYPNCSQKKPEKT
jgi:hypothetical protein